MKLSVLEELVESNQHRSCWSSPASSILPPINEQLHHKLLLLNLCFEGVVQALIAKILRESPAKATNCKSPAGSRDPRQQPIAGGPSLLTSTPCTMLLLPQTAVRTA